MGRKGRTGQFTGISTRTRIPSAALVSVSALVVGLLYGAAVPSAAQAASGSAATVTPVAATTARSVTLITGDRVTLTSVHGHNSALLVPAAGSGPSETYQEPGGDQFSSRRSPSRTWAGSSTRRCSTSRRCCATGSPPAPTSRSPWPTPPA